MQDDEEVDTQALEKRRKIQAEKIIAATDTTGNNKKFDLAGFVEGISSHRGKLRPVRALISLWTEQGLVA